VNDVHIVYVAVAIGRGFRISSSSLSWKRSGLVPIGHRWWCMLWHALDRSTQNWYPK